MLLVHTLEVLRTPIEQYLYCLTQIERLIAVAGDAQKGDLGHQFDHQTERGIKEHHLWVSIFLRSRRSRFTRSQRTATCFTMLFFSMLVNAMWYELYPESVPDGLWLGPVVLGLQPIIVGVMSNLITLIPAMLVIFCFRKARRRVLRRNRFDKAQEAEALGWQKEANRRRREGLPELVSSSNNETDSDTESRRHSRASTRSKTARKIHSSSDTRPGSSAKHTRETSAHSYGRQSSTWSTTTRRVK